MTLHQPLESRHTGINSRYLFTTKQAIYKSFFQQIQNRICLYSLQKNLNCIIILFNQELFELVTGSEMFHFSTLS